MTPIAERLLEAFSLTALEKRGRLILANSCARAVFSDHVQRIPEQMYEAGGLKAGQILFVVFGHNGRGDVSELGLAR